MAPSPLLLAGAAFLAAAGLSAVAAQGLVRTVEGRSVAAVATALDREGHGWASVLGDGLQVVVEGEAPSEAMRFRALTVAGGLVDASRVIDNMRVADADALTPPDFAVEILRNDGGVSVIGLVPASTDRDRLAAAIAEAADGQPVTDLLQAADYPAPATWEPALAYALDALADLPRSKISVAAGRVAIDALADSPEERARLETQLAREVPEDVRLALSVSAPRPVISPFTLRFRIDGGGAAFDACSADSEAARGAILAAATAAGTERQVECRLGLGAPSPDWGAAAAQGIASLHELGGGTLTFSDADVALVGAPGTDRALFDRVAGELEGALPEGFSLRAELPQLVAATPQGPPAFTATLAEGGAVRLGGRVADARTADAARTFAAARFGADQVTAAARVAPDGLPPGWSVRVLAGIEALSRLAEGRVVVTPDLVAVSGRTGDRAAGDEIAAAAIAVLGPGADLRIDVAYDPGLDPLTGLPTPAECLSRIRALTTEATIAFDPGSATIAGDAEPVIESIAEILRGCGDLRLRIDGYTDGQGRESTNLRLSQARAEAVLAALRAERVPVAGFEAVGHGEADPIADNGTEAGRIANRRIEFSLMDASEPASRSVEVIPGDAAGGASEDVPTEAAGDAPDDIPRAAPPGRPESRPATAQDD